MNPPNPSPSGLLNLHKPMGVTSRDVVNLISRPMKKIKVGHAGTLDPLATGVLVVCVGGCTRLIEYVQRMPKTYRAVIRLGATSNTLDADGEVIETVDPRVPGLEEVEAGLRTQIGTILQLPPKVSALKVQGKRAYDLVRAGEEVELAPRPVVISRVDLIRYEWPLLEIDVDCGSGTYIRSIARDLGDLFGCGGLIEVLTRTRIGTFKIEEAIDPNTLEKASIIANLRNPIEAVGTLPRHILTESDVAAILQGREVVCETPVPLDEIAMIGPDGKLLGIGEGVDEGRRVAPRRVLAGL
jgi:tRNA pseudouridine55 synthase